MKISFASLALPKKGVLVFPVADDLAFSVNLQKLNDASDGAIIKAIEAASFKGKKGQTLDILGGVGEYDRIILLGTGNDEGCVDSESEVQNLGGKLFAALEKAKIKNAVVMLGEVVGGFSPDYVAAHLAYGAKLRSYVFHHYFTKKKDEDKPQLQEIDFHLTAHTEAASKYQTLESVASGVFLARDVVSEPPNVLYPESYAEKCKELKDLGVKVEVLNEKEMQKLGMGALLGVGQGSVQESRLVIMHYNGATQKTAQPIAFVGKGVTFDTGGISLKPAPNMEEMKYDMGGSGAVVGLMKALAGRKAKVNAIGVIGLVENMPDGNAQRPGDVVTSMSGQTIEIHNTDAEGRLVLADALWYTQQRFKPKFMIDLATLTGAIVVSLGNEYAGVFSNNDELAERIFSAGQHSGEKVWRFPLGKAYDKQIDSKIADMKNIGAGRGAGSITAAQFLQRFANDTAWAHLDIAGMAWEKKGLDTVPEGATGFGVRLLDRLVAEHYEN